MQDSELLRWFLLVLVMFVGFGKDHTFISSSVSLRNIKEFHKERQHDSGTVFSLVHGVLL